MDDISQSHMSVSLEDFEHPDLSSPELRYPAAHSCFLGRGSPAPEIDFASSTAGSDVMSCTSEDESNRPRSPFAPEPNVWNTNSHGNVASSKPGSPWYRHNPYPQDGAPSRSVRRRGLRSREGSRGLEDPMEDNFDATHLSATIPLPRRSMSPPKELRTPVAAHEQLPPRFDDDGGSRSEPEAGYMSATSPGDSSCELWRYQNDDRTPTASHNSLPSPDDEDSASAHNTGDDGITVASPGSPTTPGGEDSKVRRHPDRKTAPVADASWLDACKTLCELVKLR